MRQPRPERRKARCKHGHRLAAPNLYVTKRKRDDGTVVVGRKCRQCDLDVHRRARERRKAA